MPVPTILPRYNFFWSLRLHPNWFFSLKKRAYSAVLKRISDLIFVTSYAGLGYLLFLCLLRCLDGWCSQSRWLSSPRVFAFIISLGQDVVWLCRQRSDLVIMFERWLGEGFLPLPDLSVTVGFWSRLVFTVVQFEHTCLLQTSFSAKWMFSRSSNFQHVRQLWHWHIHMLFCPWFFLSVSSSPSQRSIYNVQGSKFSRRLICFLRPL